MGWIGAGPVGFEPTTCSPSAFASLVKSQPFQDILSDLAEPRARERAGPRVRYLLSMAKIRYYRGTASASRRNLGELVFVGLGLGDRGVSLAGVEAIKSSDTAYLERYTSPPSQTLITGLEEATQRKV